jgi:hypothetical protein
MKSEFFGSKLNTILLIVLIVLMGFAIKLMLQNKQLYLHPFSQNGVQKETETKSQISGNKEDLVSFSVKPGDALHGPVFYRGTVKGAYFFEANIGISIKDADRQLLKNDHATATGDWMTTGPVDFEGMIDLSGLPKGPAYFVITADDPRDASERGGAAIKEILIPIIIE